MKRRAVIGTGGLWVVGRSAFAQPVRKVPRIGVLATGVGAEWSGPQPANIYAKALLRGLGELGYVYGQHYVTEPRGTEGKPGRYPVLAAELVALGVDAIVAAGRRSSRSRRRGGRFRSSCRPPSTPSPTVLCIAWLAPEPTSPG